MKKYLALLLALVLALGVVLTACGGDKTPETTAPKGNAGNDATDAPNDGTEGGDDEAWKEVSALVDIPEFIKKDLEHMSWMDDTSPVTLDVYYANGVAAETYPEWGSTAVQKHITDLTGVTVNGLIPNTTGGTDAMSEFTLMLSSGDPLPGIITGLDISTTQMQDLIDSDSLYDLKELAAQYAPSLLENLDPYILNVSTNADGKMFYLMRSCLTKAGTSNYYVANGWTLVRADICEDMGIDPNSIKTIADVENYLQFVVDHMADYPEIKYPILTNNLMNPNQNGALYNALGGISNYDPATSMTYHVDDDKVTWWIEDEYGKKELQTLREWAEKGFITEPSFAWSKDLFAEACAGSAAMFWGWNSWYGPYAQDSLDQNGIDAQYIQITMPSAEGVVAKQSGGAYNPGYNIGFMITKDCPDPERAIKFLDFLASEYGNMTITAGVYGEDWVAETDQFGKTVAKPMKLEPAEGELPRGTYNYNTDWIWLNSDYDFVTSYSNSTFSDNDIMTRAAQDVVLGVYEDIPATAARQILSDSDEAQWMKSLNDVMITYVPQMILAKTEAEFETLYQTCLDEMNANYNEEFKAYMLELCKAQVEKDALVGIEYTKFYG